LDARIDARVDEMIQAGLVEEMLDFHRQYNEQQLRDGLSVDCPLFVLYLHLIKMLLLVLDQELISYRYSS